MAEYALRVYRLYGIFPQQYLLYVGEEDLRMPSELKSPNFLCRYQIIDIRDLDEESLLNSPFDTDSILAILTRHRDRRETIRRILARIATLESGKRNDAFKKLMILSGLRKLGEPILEEIKRMPITHDILDHDIIGPAFRDGERTILVAQLNKRFGELPAFVEERLGKLSAYELKDLSLRIFDAQSIDDLFTH